MVEAKAAVRPFAAAETLVDLFAKGVSLEEDPLSASEAIASYQKVLKLDPGLRARPYQSWHALLQPVGLRTGGDALPQGHRSQPRYALAYFDLGNVLDETQRVEEAIAAYKSALNLAPTYADSHYNLALCLRALPGSLASPCGTGAPTSSWIAVGRGPSTPARNIKSCCNPMYGLLKSVVDSQKDKDGHEQSFFDGIDTTLSGLASRLGGEEKKVPWLRGELQSINSEIQRAAERMDSDPVDAAEPMTKVVERLDARSVNCSPATCLPRRKRICS